MFRSGELASVPLCLCGSRLPPAVRFTSATNRYARDKSALSQSLARAFDNDTLKAKQFSGLADGVRDVPDPEGDVVRRR